MPDRDDQQKTSSDSGEWFTTTHWSVVLAAGETASPQNEVALDRLCRTYWYPLYAYVRRRGSEELNVIERGERKGLTYAEIGQRHGLTESGVKSVALRLRQRYGELAREQIAQTVASVSEIDEEIRYLLTVIAEGAE